MKKIIQIAWRNLWRNKRRTLITMSSIFFALFYALLMRSFQFGTYNYMIDRTVTQFTGHLQIQDKEYMDNPTIDYSLPYTDSLQNMLNSFDDITNYFPRIQTGVMASSGPDSKIAMIMGNEINREINLIGLDKNIAQFFIDSNFVNNYVSNLDEKNATILSLYKNKFFNSRQEFIEELSAMNFDTSKYFNQIAELTKLPEIDFNNLNNEVLIGYNLAQYLNLMPGDSIILIGQGFRGSNAIGKYKIAGLLNFPINEYNRIFIYMPLKTVQQFLSAYEINGDDTTYYVNYIAINTKYQATIRLKEYDRVMKLRTEIESKLNNDMLTVVGWRTLNKNMIETIQVGNGKAAIFIFILYLVISFGVLGTVMMLIAERKREFGVMMALGMRRRFLAAIISFEMIFMGLLASLAGIIVTAPITWFGNKHPIKIHGEMANAVEKMNMEPYFLFQTFDTYVLEQVMVVMFIVFIVLIYALLKIRKLKVIESLRA